MQRDISRFLPMTSNAGVETIKKRVWKQTVDSLVLCFIDVFLVCSQITVLVSAFDQCVEREDDGARREPKNG
jgi:hypothetical protein